MIPEFPCWAGFSEDKEALLNAQLSLLAVGKQVPAGKLLLKPDAVPLLTPVDTTETPLLGRGGQLAKGSNSSKPGVNDVPVFSCVSSLVAGAVRLEDCLGGHSMSTGGHVVGAVSIDGCD